jgi:hypothetical protein
MMTSTITVCMSGTYEYARDALDRHGIRAKEIIEVAAGRPCTTAELPDSPEVREKLKGMATELRHSVISIGVVAVYEGAERA